MNLIKIFQKLYTEMFSWAFDSEFDMNRTFMDLEKFHNEALPESENKMHQLYAKIFKSNIFYLLAPVVYLVLKYYAMKYTNTEYLQRMIEKEMEE